MWGHRRGAGQVPTCLHKARGAGPAAHLPQPRVAAQVSVGWHLPIVGEAPVVGPDVDEVYVEVPAYTYTDTRHLIIFRATEGGKF